MDSVEQLRQQNQQLLDENQALKQQVEQLEASLEQVSINFEQLTNAQTMALEEARDLALEASKAKSDFLANMSHEIRTPLTAIIGFSNSLSDESLSEQDTNLATAAIIRNSHHLMDIINDILDLAKIEHQEYNQEQSEFDLLNLVHEIEESASVQAIENNLWFNIHINFPIPQFITSNPMWIKQILLNLVSNALKFTEKGGIDINVNYLAADKHNPKPKIAIEVADTGIGINEKQQHKIFERFSQADTTTTRRFGGTGLGLTICAKLVKLMGGNLTVSSVPNRGSRFMFDFEIELLTSGQLIYKPSQVITCEQELQSKITIPSLSGEILVAEDSMDTQNLVALYIKKTGANVSFAQDGKEAVEMALANNFHLVLMDMQMPNVDGIEATKVLRQIGFSKPIIAFTANATTQALDEALNAGFDEHLTKPIDKPKFYQLLAKYLPTSDSPIIEDDINLMEDSEIKAIRANFIRRTPSLLEQLKTDIHTKDWQHANVLVHTFKGTCGSLGFKGLYTITNSLEQALKQPNPANMEQIAELLNQLEQAILQAIDESIASDSIK